MKLRKFLHKSGFRFKIQYPITGKPDIVFPKNKIAILIHGCFWHQHGCKNSILPKSNKVFWKNKLRGNIKRDQIVLKKLIENQWVAKTIWECEIEGEFEKTSKLLVHFLIQNGVVLKRELK